MNSYERKTPEDLDCGITVFMKVLGGKWKPCIVDMISKGCRRPSEMHRELPTATPRVIDMQLSELEEHGIVRKEVQGGFPLRVDYFLTARGESLLPLVVAMDIWGKNNAAHIKDVVENRQTIPLN
jgi:DNA-binding HxlR family transcriptional regulator